MHAPAGGAGAPHELGAVNPPGRTDVIMGRGHGAARHPGNVRFRVTVDLHRPRYDATLDKAAKGVIIVEIMLLVQQTGRFVYRDEATGQWLDRVRAGAASEALVRQAMWLACLQPDVPVGQLERFASTFQERGGDEPNADKIVTQALYLCRQQRAEAALFQL